MLHKLILPCSNNYEITLIYIERKDKNKVDPELTQIITKLAEKLSIKELIYYFDMINFTIEELPKIQDEHIWIIDNAVVGKDDIYNDVLNISKTKQIIIPPATKIKRVKKILQPYI